MTLHTRGPPLAKSHDFDFLADTLVQEIRRDGDQLHERLFGSGSPGATKLQEQEFLAYFRSHWTDPGWRMAYLDRIAPAGPDGSRPDWGLSAWEDTIKAAWPNGYAPPPDAAPPATPPGPPPGPPPAAPPLPPMPGPPPGALGPPPLPPPDMAAPPGQPMGPPPDGPPQPPGPPPPIAS